MHFNGEIAIVTGGARGIGKAIAEKLLVDGARVILLDKLEDLLQETVSEFAKKGYNAEGIAVDLLSVSEIEKAVDSVHEKYGAIDVLINNAGVQKRLPALEFTEEDWDFVIGVNLKAAYFTSKVVAKHMIARGKGSIVCISSENSVRFASKRSLYNISKGGINTMVGSLGVEWARYGLRINAVAPGYINTEMIQAGIREGLVIEKDLMSVIPNKRFLEASEIANVVSFIASDAASGIVGQTIFVDGGMNANCLPEPKEMP